MLYGLSQPDHPRGSLRSSERSLLFAAVTFLSVGIIGCNPHKDEAQGTAEERRAMHDIASISGLWVSCPQRTELGPMFSDIQVWREGIFEMRVYGRDAHDPKWGGTVTLTGKVDTRGLELVPDPKHGVQGQRWNYVLKATDEMVLTSIVDGNVLETAYRRLEQ